MYDTVTLTRPPGTLSHRMGEGTVPFIPSNPQ
jgi:hypothetical protein